MHNACIALNRIVDTRMIIPVSFAKSKSCPIWNKDNNWLIISMSSLGSYPNKDARKKRCYQIRKKCKNCSSHIQYSVFPFFSYPFTIKQSTNIAAKQIENGCRWRNHKRKERCTKCRNKSIPDSIFCSIDQNRKRQDPVHQSFRHTSKL